MWTVVLFVEKSREDDDRDVGEDAEQHDGGCLPLNVKGEDRSDVHVKVTFSCLP